MTIFYVFSVDGPIEISPFPPSVIESDWYKNWFKYLEKKSINNFSIFYVLFNDVTELNTYIDTYKLTDSALINDINAWKAAHGFTYNSAYYTLSDASITPTPDPIVN